MLWSGSGSGLCYEKPSHRGYPSLPSGGTKPSYGQTDLVCDQRSQKFRKEKKQPLILLTALHSRYREESMKPPEMIQEAHGGEMSCSKWSLICVLVWTVNIGFLNLRKGIILRSYLPLFQLDSRKGFWQDTLGRIASPFRIQKGLLKSSKLWSPEERPQQHKNSVR